MTNSPTDGSSAPTAVKGLTEHGDEYSLDDGIPHGEYVMDVQDDCLVARVKCSRCETTTVHEGFTVFSINHAIADAGIRMQLRTYTCTVCGNLITKRV